MARLFKWDLDYSVTPDEWSKGDLILAAKSTVLFVDDIPGGVRLLCPCGQEFDDTEENDYDSCPYCGRDIVFPRADW